MVVLFINFNFHTETVTEQKQGGWTWWRLWWICWCDWSIYSLPYQSQKGYECYHKTSSCKFLLCSNAPPFFPSNEPIMSIFASIGACCFNMSYLGISQRVRLWSCNFLTEFAPSLSYLCSISYWWYGSVHLAHGWITHWANEKHGFSICFFFLFAFPYFFVFFVFNELMK